MVVNLWQYLNAVGERRAARPGWLPTDFRGWLGLGLFLQSTFLFTMIAVKTELQESQGFMTLASAVIVTGWIGGAAAFAYAAGKRDAEQQEQTRAAISLARDAVNGANGAGAGDAAEGGRQVADAAVEAADGLENKN